MEYGVITIIADFRLYLYSAECFAVRLERRLLADTVEKVESLTSLQIYQNTNDIFD